MKYEYNYSTSRGSKEKRGHLFEKEKNKNHKEREEEEEDNRYIYLKKEEKLEEGQILGFLSLGVGLGALGIPHHVAKRYLHRGLHLRSVRTGKESSN